MKAFWYRTNGEKGVYREKIHNTHPAIAGKASCMMLATSRQCSFTSRLPLAFGDSWHISTFKACWRWKLARKKLLTQVDLWPPWTPRVATRLCSRTSLTVDLMIHGWEQDSFKRHNRNKQSSQGNAASLHRCFLFRVDGQKVTCRGSALKRHNSGSKVSTRK